ncbi:MAG: nucleotide sugar dehydrogenase [Bdellovibrionota bacterium]
MTKRHYDCAVIGDWHLAFNTAACIASQGKKVLLVNSLTGGSRPWKAFPTLELNEPGLPEMIQECRARECLDFANGVTSEWSARVVWLAIDTPVNDRDEADTTPLLEVAAQVREHRNAEGPFAVSSQIPIGFSAKLEADFGLRVVYVPENLRLGKGIATFKTADRTVIGSNRVEDRQEVKSLLQGFQTEFLLCDAVTSEMVKHATNIFLATSISFANELARIGERMGADNLTVAQALKLDKRIGKAAYVAPGLGFAGGTLPRDLRIIQKIGHEREIPTPLVDAVLSVNENTAEALVDVVKNRVGEIRGKKILILGYSYKAETDTFRRSPSIELAQRLQKRGAEVHGYDSMMNQRDLSSLQGLMRHHPSWADLQVSPDMVVVMTGRPEFATLDWKKLSGPTVVLDTTSKVRAADVLAAGMTYQLLWGAPQAPKGSNVRGSW